MPIKLTLPEYNLIDAISYYASAAVPLYFVIKSRHSINNPLRIPMILLAGFVIAQGIYHTTSLFGSTLLSKGVLEPLSAAVLLATAVAYFFTTRLQKEEVRRPIGK